MEQPDLAPVANLQTIDFEKLTQGEVQEVTRMVQICDTDGFFYLDLRGWMDGKLVQSLDKCNIIVEEWFKQPVEVKDKTVTLSDAHGYKHVGQQSGVNRGARQVRPRRAREHRKSPSLTGGVFDQAQRAEAADGCVRRKARDDGQHMSGRHWLHTPERSPDETIAGTRSPI